MYVSSESLHTQNNIHTHKHTHTCLLIMDIGVAATNKRIMIFTSRINGISSRIPMVRRVVRIEAGAYSVPCVCVLYGCLYGCLCVCIMCAFMCNMCVSEIW